MSNNLIFRQLFDHDTWTYTYLLADAKTKEAVLIDTVKEQVERDLAILQELGLKLKYILDTHVHADHVTGAAKIRSATGAKTGLNKTAGVTCVDLALEDGEELAFGDFKIKAMATPGHTDTCMSYYTEGMVFTGDTLFVRDVGRTDFQQGSNQKMFDSIRGRLFKLPKDTLVYPAHDYRGRMVSTIAEEEALNPKVGLSRSFEHFKSEMEAMKLGPPKRLHLAVPANLKCGADET
jgi:glyoxylase-like metal-dependent hydrolase (beta-lactamase superfamily II)